MAKESKNKNTKKRYVFRMPQLSLPVLISAAVGFIAIVAIVLVLVLGGGKKNDAGNAGNANGTGNNGTPDNSEGLNPEDWPDNIDPDGWTTID